MSLSAHGRTLLECAAAEVAGSDRAVFEGKIECARLHHPGDTLMNILADVEQVAAVSWHDRGEHGELFCRFGRLGILGWIYV